MTPETFIKKGIEGGWLPRGDKNVYLSGIVIGGFSFNHTDTKDIFAFYMLYSEILLDPKFWQAVGKVEGWDRAIMDKEEKELARKISGKENVDWSWQEKMNGLMPALQEGKSIEEYLKTL